MILSIITAHMSYDKTFDKYNRMIFELITRN